MKGTLFEMEKGQNEVSGSNMELMSGTKKKKEKKPSQKELEQQVKLSKNMQRKLRRLQEEEEKKKLRVQVMETLEKHKLADDKFDLLHSSATRGQEETMKEKLQRAMNYKRAGLPVPSDVPLFRERPNGQSELNQDPMEEEEPEQVRAATKAQSRTVLEPSRAAPTQMRVSTGEELVDDDRPAKAKSLKRKKFTVGLNPDTEENDKPESEKKSKKSDETPDIEDGAASCVTTAPSQDAPKNKKKKKKRKKKEAAPVEDVDEASSPVIDVEMAAVEPEDVLPSLRPQDMYLKEALDTQAVKVDLKLRKVVVPISRPEDVVKGRENLPIVMMEQEIIEAISENDVVIVCGETGCGKTTQVPQFLFEAGFGSSLCPEKSGVIGVTQPRRVAVLATAKRVAYEMNVALGQEVGFQVRHDRKIGSKSSIKFMTDGILLREVQVLFWVSNLLISRLS